MSDKSISRREFIERSVAGAAVATAAWGTAIRSSSASPNETVTMGIIGAGIRGLENMQSILNVKGRVVIVFSLPDPPNHLPWVRLETY